MKHTVREIALERAKEHWADPNRSTPKPWFQGPWARKVSSVLEKIDQCMSRIVIGDLKNVKDSD